MGCTYPETGGKWLRIQRAGNVLRGYCGDDGVNWNAPVSQDTANWLSPVGGVPTPFASSALLGFAVSRHGCANQPTATAQFLGFAQLAPTIVTPPADVATVVGLTATFSVAAGGDYTSVQWLRNGGVIPGAKSTSYTTPMLTTADNGSTFSAVVSNYITGAAVASASANLQRRRRRGGGFGGHGRQSQRSDRGLRQSRRRHGREHGQLQHR